MMRALVTLPLLAATLAACGVQTQPDVRTPRAQTELDHFLAGRTAGKPVSCINDNRTDQMTVIDENTFIFRDGSRVYRNDPPGGCIGSGRPGNTLVFNRFGGGGLCRGEIIHVTDLTTGSFGGSCALGDFVPFDKPTKK
jgi:hypothetical protein